MNENFEEDENDPDIDESSYLEKVMADAMFSIADGVSTFFVLLGVAAIILAFLYGLSL